MTIHDFKRSARACCVFLFALLVAGTASAEDDIPPFEPLTAVVDFFRDAWSFLTSWV